MQIKFIPILLLFSLTAAASGIDIPRFAKVTNNIYRGSRPDEQTIAALSSMHIKTIVDLENDSQVVQEEIQIASRYGIRVISIPMSGFWRPTNEQVQLSLGALSDPGNQPVFVHCQHGEDRTGLIVGLYRVMEQQWSPKAAWLEMRKNGFHRILFFLKQYFEDATGFEI